jgi:C4-dicarboxylate-specific signal transduction histidine kinase
MSLSISYLQGRTKKQLLSLRRKWEKVDEKAGEAIHRWEHTEGYENQKVSAIKALTREREKAQENLRQIKAWLVNANPHVPKGRFISCKAVKFNRNGSVSIKK